MARVNPEAQLAVKLYAHHRGDLGLPTKELHPGVQLRACTDAARLMSMARSLRRLYAKFSEQRRSNRAHSLTSAEWARVNRLEPAIRELVKSYGLKCEFDPLVIHFPDGSSNGDGPGWSI